MIGDLGNAKHLMDIGPDFVCCFATCVRNGQKLFFDERLLLFVTFRLSAPFGDQRRGNCIFVFEIAVGTNLDFFGVDLSADILPPPPDQA